MRTIDADALKELFSEVIGHIAKKPEMNGNLEHMIRASAMVIQMIDDAPTVQPDTTTHDSIPAETGKNDGDGTSDDCISRQQAIEVLRNRWLKTRNYEGIGEDIAEECEIYLKTLPSIQPERKIGRWIPTASEKGRHECSRCHEYAPCYQDGSEHLSTFCVLCGAKMERGEEE